METANDPAPMTAAAPREEDPDPEPEGAPAAPILDHHFQRPTVSPVSPDVRTAPRGG